MEGMTLRRRIDSGTGDYSLLICDGVGFFEEGMPTSEIFLDS
jgi:hypothetical protein